MEMERVKQIKKEQTKNQVKKRHLLLMKVRRKVETQGMQRIP